jgi:glycosyltransferase involved in cell wall biosynthesis
MPKVSVLIPTYNSAAFLDDAIQSVLAQTFSDFELIIADNSSTDNSAEIIAPYLSDKRIKYFVNDRNLGSTGNFNKCLSLATGELIKCLCSDDILHHETVEKFVFVMDRYPEVSLVSSHFHEFGNGTKLVVPPFSGLADGKKIIAEVLAGKNFLGNPSQVMFRRKDLRIGLFKEISVWNVDLEFFFRILSLGKGYIIPEVLSYTRLHPGAQSQTMVKTFSHYFGDYDLVKALEKNESNVDFSGLDIKKFLRQKAKECTLVLPLSLQKVQKREYRKAFIKALKIAYQEKVLLSAFPFFGKKIFGKVSLFVSQALAPLSNFLSES